MKKGVGKEIQGRVKKENMTEKKSLQQMTTMTNHIFITKSCCKRYTKDKPHQDVNENRKEN